MGIIPTYGDLDVVFVYNEKSGLSPYMGIIPMYGDLDFYFPSVSLQTKEFYFLF